jgi:hypothetical protein
MAPGLKKRPAATEDEGAGAKKRKIAEALTAVSEAVHEASLPKDVIAMLGTKKLLKECLGIPKEDRHAYQEQVIQMLTEVMESVEADYKSSIADAEAQVAGSDVDKEAKEAAEKTAGEALEAKKQAAEAAKAAENEVADAVKAAKLALACAESDQTDGAAALAKAGGLKEKLEAAQNGTYAALKAGTAEKVGDAVAELAILGEEFAFDGTLITSLPGALKKAPSDRGAFDEMVCKQVEDELAKHIAAQTEILTTGETATAARAQKVVDATAALESAEAAKTKATEAKTEAVAAQKDAEGALKDAAKAVRGHSASTKQAQNDLESSKEALVEFCNVTKAAFAELVSYTLIVPEAPADAEPAPAEEAAAEAPAEPAAP